MCDRPLHAAYLQELDAKGFTQHPKLIALWLVADESLELATIDSAIAILVKALHHNVDILVIQPHRRDIVLVAVTAAAAALV